MKNKTLLVFLSMAMTICANAAQWIRPAAPVISKASVFQPSEEKGSGDTYYLWNEEKMAFLAEGNDWNVRATLRADRGVELYFSKYKVDGVWQTGNYIFNVYTTGNQSGRWDWMWIPLDNNLYCYTDYKQPGEDRHYSGTPVWSYEIFDGDYLMISTGSQQEVWNETEQGSKMYLGKPFEGELSENSIIYPNCTPDDNVYWSVVTKTDYESYINRLATYDKAVELSQAIETSKGKNPGIDLSSVESVYENTSSTLTELQNAIDAIPEIEKNFASNNISNASVTNPFDATAYITNPNYDGNVNGWEGISTAWYNTVAEKWSDNTNPYDINQTIKDLPNGVYEIKVHSFHRIGNPDWDNYKTGTLPETEQYRRTSQIYGNGFWVLNKDLTDEPTEDPIHTDQYVRKATGCVPDGLAYVDKAFNQYDMYDNSLFVGVYNGTLKIGVRCNNREKYSWTPIDTWRLSYYGDSAEATELLKAHLKTNLKDYSMYLVQSTLKEQYTAAIAKMNNATTYADVESAYAEAMNLFYDLEKSKNAYESLTTLAETIAPQCEELDCDANDELLDFLDGTTEGTLGYIIQNTNLSVEELAETEKWMKDKLEEAIKNTVAEGRDYTSLIANPNWEERDLTASGWTLDKWKGQTIVGRDGAAAYYCAEVWNYKSFNLNQTLTGMPEGIYKLSLPALYRACDNDYSHASTCEIYINKLAKNVMKASEDAVTNETAASAPDNYPNWDNLDGYNCYNVNSSSWDGPWPNDFMNDIDGNTLFWPGSTGGAGVAFNAGRYVNDVYGIVGEDGILKFGFRSKNQSGQDGDWLCMGRMTLTYMGSNADALAGLKSEVEQQAAIYQNSTERFYNGYRNDIEDCLIELDKASTKNDVLAAVDSLNSLFATIDKSVGLYKELYKAVGGEGTGLYAVAIRAAETGSLSVDEAQALMAKAEEYIAGYDDCTYDNETVQRIIDEVMANPLVDVIYIRGGLLGSTGDDYGSFDFPMYKNAEGKYVGIGKFRDERHGNIEKYAGNRALVVFHYMGQDICAKNNSERFLNLSTAPRALKINDNTSWFLTWGGEWEFTIDLEAETMTCKPVGEMLYKQQIYAVGNLQSNNWNLSESTADNWQIQHQGNGIYQGSIAFGEGVQRGEITLFASDMWLTNSWGDGRIGSVEDQLPLESGQTTACDRFEGDRKWILDPNHHYLVTYNVHTNTVRFDARDLQGGDTEESPLLIDNYEDLMMVRSYLRQNQTHYFALTNNISMEGRPWTQLNGIGEQDGRECQRWIHFDGRNHFINGFGGDTGLQSTANNSFFGTLGGTVKNLGFVNTNISENEQYLADYGVAHSQSMSAVAGILGAATYSGTTTVENVFVEGELAGGMNYTGALAGTVNGATNITNAYANASVAGEESVAGLVGRVNGALNIQNAYFAGTVSGNGEAVAPVAATYTVSAPAATYNNVVNWTSMTFGNYRDADAVTNTYNFDGSNFAALQQTVVDFDNKVWACTMADGEYPVLAAFSDAFTGITGNKAFAGDDNMQVYTVNGTLVYSGKKTNIKVPAGVYVVKSGNTVRKVLF